MRRLIGELFSAGKDEAFHMDQVTMTQFIPTKEPTAENVIQVFDAHNATWAILDRMRQNVSWLLKPLLAMEAQRMRRFEADTVQRCDWTLVVTQADLEALREASGIDGSVLEKFVVMPIAVDTRRLKPIERNPEAQHVLTFGTLHYAPNAEGIRWFLRQVWPEVLARLPGATLTIAGANPPEDFLRYAKKQSKHVRVTGFVEDLEPYIAQASVMVVPVLSGSGMRVRILEALSRAMPVVSTTIGAEGIEVRHGEHLLVADEPIEFAEALVNLLTDTALQDHLTENARKLAVSNYDWRVALAPLDRIYPNRSVDNLPAHHANQNRVISEP
jgi:glycosyltransferase involved in cell wall biosynthesis